MSVLNFKSTDFIHLHPPCPAWKKAPRDSKVLRRITLLSAKTPQIGAAKACATACARVRTDRSVSLSPKSCWRAKFTAGSRPASIPSIALMQQSCRIIMVGGDFSTSCNHHPAQNHQLFSRKQSPLRENKRFHFGVYLNLREGCNLV